MALLLWLDRQVQAVERAVMQALAESYIEPEDEQEYLRRMN